MEADALSCIPWESAQVEHMEPLIVKTILQSKLESEINFPEGHFPVKLLLKSMTVDTTLKLTQKDWIKEQMHDVDVNKIVQLLKSNMLSTYMAQEMDSSAIQILLRYKKDLLLKNGLLYRRTILKNHPEPVAQFVLPKRFICKVILACHDDNRHLGMERTLRLLQERFFWPKMAEDVQTHIRTCERCLRFKQSQEKAGMQPILVSYPMELIHLDFLTLGGKARNTKSTNILVITDHFTKYAQAYITQKQTAVVVAHILWENFLVHYGWPEKILSDQGKSFENNLFQELCSLARVKNLCTSPYHPETNGQCEHFNATLISMLGTLPSHAKKNWKEWVTTLTHAYNCTVSPITGFSPYLLMFGRIPKLPLDIDLGIPMVEQEPTSQQNYAQKLHSKLQWAYQKAQDNNKRESECHKRYYDQKMRCMKLEPDDLVMVRVKALTGDHKIADRWEDTPH